MQRTSWSLLFTVLAFAGTVAVGAPRPNVLFIAVDDLNVALGCYGDTLARTPQIDTLASQGTIFRNHHCQWAVCGPSRAAMTTSLMPEETNVMGFRKIRDKNYLPNVTTLPQHFRNHGYETACTGKFHDNRTVGTPVPISTTYPDGVMDDGKDVDDPDSWSVPYVNAGNGFNTPTKVAVDSTDQSDSLYEDHRILTEGIALIDDLTSGGGAAPGNKPFFLAVGFKKPHLPFVAPKPYWDLHDRNALPLAAFTSLPNGTTAYNAATLADNSEIGGGGGDTTNGYLPYSTTGLLPDAAQQRELIHGYYACVSFIDQLVGQLRTKLATTSDPNQPGKTLAQTTVIVFWSDHGFHLGDHGHWAKHTAMDGATASPLIIFDPRNPREANNNNTFSPVGTIDIYPTLCELAGLPIPEQPASSATISGRPIRGRSLVSVMNDPARSVHHGVVTQFNISGQYGYAYRTGRFRYIEWINASGNMNDGNARRDLFDYAADPLEAQNVATDPAYAAIVYQLSRSLRAETTVRGTGRLNNAPPIATGGDARLPDLTITRATATTATLAWPSSGGVSYDVFGSTTLATGSWTADFTNAQGPTQTISLTGGRRFFVVGFGTNVPPVFTSDPVVKTDAAVGAFYSGSLATQVIDANAGDTISFSKVQGPAWLGISANGALTGTPTTGDAGANYFLVQAADAAGNAARATLEINVIDSTAPTITIPTQTDTSGSGNYGSAFFTSVGVQVGDLIVVAHAPNKNTSTNTITLSGVGSNSVSSVDSGSSGTGSSAWVFTVPVTSAGTYDLVLDTSNATKTVSHASSLFVFRPLNGSLVLAASDGSVAGPAPGITSLSLDFNASPAVSNAYGVAAASMNTSTFTGAPSGWVQEVATASKRMTCSTTGLNGSAFAVTFPATAATDIALAGVAVSVVP